MRRIAAVDGAARLRASVMLWIVKLSGPLAEHQRSIKSRVAMEIDARACSLARRVAADRGERGSRPRRRGECLQRGLSVRAVSRPCKFSAVTATFKITSSRNLS